MKKYRQLIMAPVIAAVFLVPTVAHAEDTTTDDHGMRVDIGVDGHVQADISTSGPVKLSVEARGPAQVGINADAEVTLDVEGSNEAEITIKQQKDKSDAKPETGHRSRTVVLDSNLWPSSSHCIGLNKYVAIILAAFPLVGLSAFSFILRFMKMNHSHKSNHRG